MKLTRSAVEFALLIAIATACSRVGGVATGGRVNSWTTPHVLTMSDAGDINTLNPHFGQTGSVGLLSSMTMAWLVKWDGHNNPYPELATEVPTQQNGGVSKDGLTITYHLRKGVKWSDGVPFDADDVIFTTKVILNPATNETGRLGWDQIASMQEPDRHTVVFHLRKPYSPFIETFFSSNGINPCVLPKHLLAKYSNINNVPYNSLPVGIGPFKYQSWQRSDRVVMVANPLYFRGRPKLDTVVYKIIPDRNTLLSQLQAHEVDMWYWFTGHYLSPLQQLSDYAVLRQPGYAYNHLDFNITRPAVADPAVREALRMALDRAAIRHKIRNDVGVLQEVTTPSTAPYAVRDIPMVPFDIAGANRLLDQHGWKRGGDGIREKSGVRLSLTMASTTGTQDVDNMTELIRAWWSQIGVDLNVKRFPSSTMFAPVESGGIVNGNKWDVIYFAWVNDPIGDYSPEYGCSQFPPKGSNNIRWCNPKAQAAMDALYTHFSQSQRNDDVAIVQREFVRDVPSIVIGLNEYLYAYNKDLKNFHPDDVAPFDNMMDVDI